jgi:hypothetical protein
MEEKGDPKIESHKYKQVITGKTTKANQQRNDSP